MDQKMGESLHESRGPAYPTFTALLWLVLTTSKGKMPVMSRFPRWLPESLFPGWCQLIRSICGRRSESITSKRKTYKCVYSERSSLAGYPSTCLCCHAIIAGSLSEPRPAYSVSVAHQLATVIPIPSLLSQALVFQAGNHVHPAFMWGRSPFPRN